MLGHADVGVTLKIYHHVDAKAIREMHTERSPLMRLDETLVKFNSSLGVKTIS